MENDNEMRWGRRTSDLEGQFRAVNVSALVRGDSTERRGCYGDPLDPTDSGLDFDLDEDEIDLYSEETSTLSARALLGIED